MDHIRQERDAVVVRHQSVEHIGCVAIEPINIISVVIIASLLDGSSTRTDTPQTRTYQQGNVVDVGLLKCGGQLDPFWGVHASISSRPVGRTLGEVCVCVWCAIGAGSVARSGHGTLGGCRTWQCPGPVQFWMSQLRRRRVISNLVLLARTHRLSTMAPKFVSASS